MKHFYFILACTVMMACHREPSTERFPVLEVSSNEWATYEGIILTDNGEVLDIEISLKEGPVGMESYYVFSGERKGENLPSWHTWKGKYIVTPNAADQSFGIHLMNIRTGVKGYTFFERHDFEKLKFTKPPEFTEMDLFFVTSGDGRLVLTDDAFHPVADDDLYTIRKRSNLFTIEGYVTVQSNENESEFFERNTHVNWRIAPFGDYWRIKRHYLELATEPNEGVYLRALAYTIDDSLGTGKASERLVVKKIVKMGAAGK